VLALTANATRGRGTRRVHGFSDFASRPVGRETWMFAFASQHLMFTRSLCVPTDYLIITRGYDKHTRCLNLHSSGHTITLYTHTLHAIMFTRQPTTTEKKHKCQFNNNKSIPSIIYATCKHNAAAPRAACARRVDRVARHAKHTLVKTHTRTRTHTHTPWHHTQVSF